MSVATITGRDILLGATTLAAIGTEIAATAPARAETQTAEARTGNAPSRSLSPAELQSRLLHRGAVEAAIWGMPIVAFDAKWKTINLGATVPGLNRFPAAQEWLDRQSGKVAAKP
jgi:hypothetical protein